MATDPTFPEGLGRPTRHIPVQDPLEPEDSMFPFPSRANHSFLFEANDLCP